jgi:hypothetical protein
MSDVKQKKWAEAEAKLLGALALNPSYDVAVNLGQTQYRLGKYRDAAENIAFALRSWPIVAKKEQREAAVKRLEEVRKLVATVTIRVSVPGAMVLVDGKEIGRSPLTAEVFVDPGTRTIEAKLAGFLDAKQTITTVKGDAQELSIALIPAAQQGSSSNGRTERNTGGGGVAVGGAVREPSEPQPSGKSGMLIGGGISVAVVGIGIGIGGAVAANNNANSADDVRSMLAARDGTGACKQSVNATPCEELRSSFEASGTFRTVSIVGFAIAGTAAVATMVYGLVPSGKTERRRVMAAMTLMPGGSAAVVMGRF